MYGRINIARAVAHINTRQQLYLPLSVYLSHSDIRTWIPTTQVSPPANIFR